MYSQISDKANEQAIFSLYTYLAHKTTPVKHETLVSIVEGLETAFKNRKPAAWKSSDIRRLYILRNAVDKHPALAASKIDHLSRSKDGLTACTFTKPNGDISVVFKGTGSGEWLDNGEGLSGIPEENTYILYGENGEVLFRKAVQNDHATDQQVEALNWFRHIAAKSGWNTDTSITVSGHSKGGNKAQFVAVHADLVNTCYSFDGQGFSPEGLTALQLQYGTEFEQRRQKLYSISADNDYVNVLGERLVPKKHIYYVKSVMGLHPLEAILDENGSLRAPCEQGKLSRYVESVSKELMRIPPATRQYATLGIMNLFQKHVGEGTPVNGDAVSVEKTVAGIAIAISSL